MSEPKGWEAIWAAAKQLDADLVQKVKELSPAQKVFSAVIWPMFIPMWADVP